MPKFLEVTDQVAARSALGVPGIASADNLVIYVSSAGDDANDGLSTGSPKLTVAAALAELLTGGEVRIGAGTFTESAWTTAVAAMPSAAKITISGTGPATVIQFATPNSALLLADTKRNIKIRDLTLNLTAAATNSVLVDMSNSFKCSFQGVTFSGQHVDRTAETYRTQIGVKLRDNAGDNKFINCDFANLGIAVETASIQNYFSHCVWGHNWRSVVGGNDAGYTGVGGIAISDSTFQGSSTDSVDTHIFVRGASSTWWLNNVWIEGCQHGIVIGDATYGGPVTFSMHNVKVASVVQCIKIIAARQTYMSNVYFSIDLAEILWPGGVVDEPITITVEDDAIDGYAVNLVPTFADGYGVIATDIFPSRWTYIPRFFETAQFSAQNAAIGMGLSTGASNASYYECGGSRARFGYDGTSVIMSDAAEGLEVRLRSGASPLDGVRVSGTGVGFNGTAPVAKPTVTGSVDSGALTSLLTGLASQGLITDSTTDYVSGNYYFCNSQSAASTGSTSNAVVRVSPWVVKDSVTVTRLFAEFTVAGDANSVLRLGIWSHDLTTGQPTTLVLDAGTISTGTGDAGDVATGGTPGVYEITVSQALTPGIYWVGGAIQGVSVSQPTLRVVDVASLTTLIPQGTSLPAAGAVNYGWTKTGVSGALATITGPARNAGTPAVRVGFKVA